MSSGRRQGMTAKEFFYLVEDMRKAQKDYFKTRDKEVLVKSKELEKRVDEEIKRVAEILGKRDNKKENHYPRGC